MRKITTTAALAASESAAEQQTPAPPSDIRDEFAMRAMAAIISGIVSRGGIQAVASVLCDDVLLQSSYDLADTAMRVRAKS